MPTEVVVAIIFAVVQIPIAILGATMLKEYSKVPPVTAGLSAVAILIFLLLFWAGLISDKWLIGIAIGLTLISVGVCLLYIFRYKPKSKVSRKKASDLKQIPDTLTEMHHQIRQLREELAKGDIGKEKAMRLQEKMNKTIPISDGAKKRIQGWQRSGQTAKFIRGVQLVDKWAVGDVYGTGYENQICDMGGMLETEDVGLKPILGSDPQYVSLKNRLETQYAGTPRSVTKPILKYERYLYGLSSVFVWDVYRIRYLGKQLPTVVEAKITQYSSHAEDEILNRLKEDVVKAINEYIERHNG